MQSWTPNFKGLSRSGYGIEICDGTHFGTPQGEFVEMSHGQEYYIKVLNANKHQCSFNLNIDGFEQGVWQFGEEWLANIRHPSHVAKKFTFYRVQYAPKTSGITPRNGANGLVSCTFTPEINAPMIKMTVTLLGISSVSPCIEFSMLEKNTTRDLAEFLAMKFSITDVNEHQIIRWKAEGPTDRVQSLVDLKGSHDCFLSDWDFKDGEAYKLSVLQKIRTVKVIFSNDSFEFHASPDKITLKTLMRKITMRWDLKQFYLHFENRRPFAHSGWPEDLELFELLRREEIKAAVENNIITISLTKENLSQPKYFQVFVISMTGKKAPLYVGPTTTVYEMKLILESIEGLPTDHQTLLYGGRPLENGQTLAYCNVQPERTIHMVAKLPGGRSHADTLEIIQAKRKLKDLSDSEDSEPEEPLEAPNPEWRAGGTTLGRTSNQRYRDVAPINVDPSRAVTLSVRLVVRGDKLTRKDYSRYEKIKCTPLKTAIPPRVPE